MTTRFKNAIDAPEDQARKIMYTQDGQEVSLVRKVEEGYLAFPLYTYDPFDEEDDRFEGDQIFFYQNLHEKPVLQRYASEVQDLINQKERLSLEIEELHEKAYNEKGLLSKVSEYPVLSMLAAYLTKDFSHVVYLDNLEIKDYRNVSIGTPRVGLEGSDWAIKVQRGSYESDRDRPLVVFKTLELAEQFAKKKLLHRINSASYNYNKSGNLKKLLDDIDRDCISKRDPEVISAYEKKMAAFVSEEQEERKKKALEELENAQKKLQQLQS